MPTNTPDKKPVVPFWQPWGPMGCLWRTLLFLLGIVILSVIFSIIKRCGDDNKYDDDSSDKKSKYYEPYNNGPLPGQEPGFDPGVPLPLPDSIPAYDDRERAPIVEEWNDTIPGVSELPAPEENRIPPIDDNRIIEDPEDPYAQILAGQIAVFFNSKDLKTDMTDFARQFKQNYPSGEYQIAYYNPIAGTMLLAVPDDRVTAMLEELPQTITGMQFRVTTNEIMGERYVPNDPMFRHPVAQEYFDLIQAFDAWDITKGNPDVKVAIVDSFFDLTNPEIGTRFVDPIHIPSKTRAILPPNIEPTNKDEYGILMHGSHVAGIAVGAQDNGHGVSGIAPECTLIPVSLGGELTDFNIIEGILYAIYQGADVVNVSLGRKFPEGLSDMLSLEDQAEYSRNIAKRSEEIWKYVGQVALDHNCVIVVSAGNESLLMGMDPMNRPNNMIKVEAVDGNSNKVDFSNYGKVPEEQLDYSTVSAPGHALWSVLPRQTLSFANSQGIPTSPDGFGAAGGTSMAAPVVTGAVALLKSVNKNLSGEEIIKILVETAKPVDKKDHIGPVIQIADALKMAQSMKDNTNPDLPEGTGEMMNFDEVLKDHNLLVGRWKSTYELVIISSDGTEKEKIWTYFVFTSPTSGYLEYRPIATHQVYTAPVSVTWTDNSIQLKQLSKATCPGETPIRIYDFICRPDAKRQLETDVIENGRKKFGFLLEKVK